MYPVLAAKYLIIVLELVKLPSEVSNRGSVGIDDRSFKSKNVYLGTSTTSDPRAEITLFILRYRYWIGRSVQ